MDEFKEIFDKYLKAQKTRDIKSLVKFFKDIVTSRNNIAKENGFTDYVDMFVKKTYRIPDSDWQKYLSNKNSFADKYSPHLESSSSSPHFLTSLPDIGMKYPGGVIDFVANNFPVINEVRDKITIESSDTGAYFRYSKEDGKYTIYISETNSNQKVSMLIHELAHVIYWEKQNHQIESTYLAEFEAHKIEFELAKDISKEFLQAVIGEYLMCLVRTDFQIAMFTNPSLDPINTYSDCFAKYIGKLNAENQTDFLFDTKLTHNPLVDLPDAVSLVNLLT